MISTELIHKIALGTAQFGLNYGIASNYTKTTAEECKKILAGCYKSGIRMLDTAISYGDCESILGRIGISGWKVTTKLPTINCLDSQIYDVIARHVENSIERLGSNPLYGLYLHDPKQLKHKSGDKIAECIFDLRSKGFFDKIGVSIYDPSELSWISDIIPIDIVQTPINILDNRLVQSGWAKKLKLMGVEIHGRSIFLQGLLLINRECRPAKFKAWDPIWNLFDEWLVNNKLEPFGACLSYALSIEEVDKFVIGIGSVSQLQQLLDTKIYNINDTTIFTEKIDPVLLNPSLWPM